EKSLYQNHLYLICLLSFLFVFIGGNNWLSVDNRAGKLSPFVHRWNLLLLRVQFVIIYLFSGLAKFNGDWLHGNPQSSWLAQRVADP
ncbi:HTTM domain-containing protein, partial [Vibrio parahaemolyticus]